MRELWSEKYRPKNLKGYVFKNPKQKKQIEKWIAEGTLPHMLLSGSPGTGKSSLIKVLLNELKINPFDVLEVNASKDNGIDYIRDTVSRFAETMGYGPMKYVFLDEADGLSSAAQGTLRETTERYSSSVRFLLTCNYPHKIIPALHSRCEAGKMHIEDLDKSEFYSRLITILDSEHIKINPDALEEIVQKTYPDLRRGIGMSEKNSLDGILHSPGDDSKNESDYRIDMVALFKLGKYREARELICKQAPREEYEGIFTFLYQNLEIFGDTDEKQGKCILVIRDGLVKHLSCADPEINLSATIVELEMVSKGLT